MRTFTLTFIFSLILSNCTFCQDLKASDDSTITAIKFSEVVAVDSSSKSQLYSKAREWFSKNFKSAKTVLDLEDKETGKLIGKANFTVYSTEASSENEFVKLPKSLSSKKIKEAMNEKKTIEVGRIDFTISIYVKDNKYKYEITNAFHKGEIQTVLGYTVTIPNGGDIANVNPGCGYGEMMPRVRWQNIRTNRPI